MAIISFSEDGNRNWVVAGWAFRRILDEVRSRNPQDPEMAEALSLADELGYLTVYLLEPALSVRVREAFRRVASDLLREPSEEFVDEHVDASWRRSMDALLKVSQGNTCQPERSG